MTNSLPPHPPPPSPPEPRILIIGAGITGLTLAQCLKKDSIPFTIFERDPSVSFPRRDWGLTIDWSLDTFLSLLPQHLIDRLPSAYVDPALTARGENGCPRFFDLQTGEARWKMPPLKSIRVSRERLRELLLDGLDVRWSMTFTHFDVHDTWYQTVTAYFNDPTTVTSVTGALLIGADGIHSGVRSFLMWRNQQQHLAKNNVLPVRALCASLNYPLHLALELRALDPFFVVGGHFATDTFMHMSILETPYSYILREGKDSLAFECQIMLSWPYHTGWLGHAAPTEIPEGKTERVRFMKEISKGWAEPFRKMMQAIPENETEVMAFTLEDWVPKERMWDNLRGRVTLMGDAAHTMTMFRGEGYNHSIADIGAFMQYLRPGLQGFGKSRVVDPSRLSYMTLVTERPDMSLEYVEAHRDAISALEMTRVARQDAINTYEQEMIQRTKTAVLTSRRACMDAHDYTRINDQSPLISKNLWVTEE